MDDLVHPEKPEKRQKQLISSENPGRNHQTVWYRANKIRDVLGHNSNSRAENSNSA